MSTVRVVIDDRRRAILRAALEVFIRYGYRRATMGDIAREAKLSRPSLYLIFPSKEAVFRDVVEVGLSEMLDEIEAGVSGLASLEAQLEQVFEIWSVRPLELVLRSPDAHELMTASFDFVQDVFDRGSMRLTGIVTRLIRGSVGDPDSLAPSAEVRARILVASAHGFKTAAKDPHDMRELIKNLARMTVAGLPVRSEEAQGTATSGRKSRRRPARQRRT